MWMRFGEGREGLIDTELESENSEGIHGLNEWWDGYTYI
jgi:hypothetical protein